METVKITCTLSHIVSSNFQVIDRFLLEKDTKIALKVEGQGQMLVNCNHFCCICVVMSSVSIHHNRYWDQVTSLGDQQFCLSILHGQTRRRVDIRAHGID